MNDFEKLGFGGFPLLGNMRTRSVCQKKPTGENGPPKWSLYRWHLMDPICFGKDLRVTIQALGWWPGKHPNKKFQPLADDIVSVAYWYQQEPHAPFPAWPR